MAKVQSPQELNEKYWCSKESTTSLTSSEVGNWLVGRVHCRSRLQPYCQPRGYSPVREFPSVIVQLFFNISFKMKHLVLKLVHT